VDSIYDIVWWGTLAVVAIIIISLFTSYLANRGFSKDSLLVGPDCAAAGFGFAIHRLFDFIRDKSVAPYNNYLILYIFLLVVAVMCIVPATVEKQKVLGLAAWTQPKVDSDRMVNINRRADSPTTRITIWNVLVSFTWGSIPLFFAAGANVRF
jgi:hypothetical protein